MGSRAGGPKRHFLTHPGTILAICDSLCHRIDVEFGIVSLRPGASVPDEAGVARNRFAAADGYALRRAEPGGILISRSAWSVFVPEGAVAWAVVAEPGETAVLALCSDCSPPRRFENLTALRSHQRHKHDQSRKRTD